MKSIPLCQCCQEQGMTATAQWAWQPFGPADTALSFAELGKARVGHPVIKICDSCKHLIESGTSPRFTYHGLTYAYKDGEIRVIGSLWNGGGTSWNYDGTGNASMICQDTRTGNEVVAIVHDEDLTQLFITAPELLAITTQLVKLLSAYEELPDDERMLLYDARRVLKEQRGVYATKEAQP